MCPVARSRPALDTGLTRICVVAAAIVRDGRVLAARRVRPVTGWEFPGGKVEPGESPQQAIERECLEELGLPVRAQRRIGTARDDRIELELWHVSSPHDAVVALRDHDEVRWLEPDGLATVDWLPADRALLNVVVALLAGT